MYHDKKLKPPWSTADSSEMTENYLAKQKAQQQGIGTDRNVAELNFSMPQIMTKAW